MAQIRYAATILALPLSIMAGAQSITLVDPGNTPVVGGTFLVHSAAYVAPGAGGSAQTFDFSSLISTGTVTYTWDSPSISPNAGLFPSADIALVNGGADTIFYATSANGLVRVGEDQLFTLLGTSYQVTATYSDGIQELKLPLTFNGTWNDADAATFTVQGNSAMRAGSITGSADAWGNLQLPGVAAPVEVLRVVTHLSESNNITSIPVPVTHKRDVVAYYPLWGKFPVLRTIADTLSSTLTQPQGSAITEWLDPAYVGIPEAASVSTRLQIAPNPATNTAIINFTGTDTRAMQVLDARGAVVVQRVLSATKSAIGLERLDVSGWADGVYQVLLIGTEGSRATGRFMVAH